MRRFCFVIALVAGWLAGGQVVQAQPGYGKPSKPTFPSGTGFQPSKPPSGGGFKPPSMPPGGGIKPPSLPSGGGFKPPSGGGSKPPSLPSGGGFKPPSLPPGGGLKPPMFPPGGGSNFPPLSNLGGGGGFPPLPNLGNGGGFPPLVPPNGGGVFPPLPNLGGGGGFPPLPPLGGGGGPPVIILLKPPVVPVNPDPILIVPPNGGSDIEEETQPAEEYGMKITQLAPKGAAAAANLQVGHIIVSVGEERVRSFDELTAILAKAEGEVEFIVFVEETRQYAKTTVTPVNGKIGVATEPVVLK